MLKQIKIILILLLIVVLIGAFFRHGLCRFLIEMATNKATGLKLSIEKLNLNVLKSSLDMRGITLFNPPGFKNEVLGKANQISIKYCPLSFFAGRPHLRLVKLDIGEINIIRNEQAHSNLVAFKSWTPKPKSSRPSSAPSAQEQPQKQTPKASKGKKRPRFLIDRLELSLEKVTFTDYRAGVGEPAVIIFTIEGPSVFKNVSDLSYVVGSVSAKGGFKSVLDNLLERMRDLFPKNK